MSDLDAARALAANGDDRIFEAMCTNQLAFALVQMGREDAAEAALRDGLLRLVGDDAQVCSMRSAFLRTQMMVARSRGRYDDARSLGTWALREAEASGSRHRRKGVLEILASIELAQGQFDRAEQYLVQAAELGHWLGVLAVGVGSFNLGLVYLRQGRMDEAGRMFRQARRSFDRRGKRHFVAATDVALLVFDALDGRWSDFDLRIADAEVGLAETGFSDDDVAELAEQAAEVATQGGRLTRARRAFALAEQIWASMGHEERAARVARRLEEVSGEGWSDSPDP